MKEKEKTSAYTNIESEFVEAEGFKWSDLINKEDWLAIWIGFIIIATGAFAVITGSFDFSAAKFSTWGNGTSVLEQLNSEFALKLIRTFVVLAVLFTAGAVLKGQGIKKYLPAFAVLFVLAIIVRFISAQYTMNRYLEWAF